MKTLVAGFEPFAGDAVNPAREAVLRLPSRLGGLAIHTRVLPTVFGRAIAALEDALVTARPDIVLAVGLAGGRAELSLERVAINVDDARIPDNDGQQPLDRPVVDGGPADARGRPAGDRLEHRRHLCLQPRLLRADASGGDAASGPPRRLFACAVSAEPGGTVQRRPVDGARPDRRGHRDHPADR